MHFRTLERSALRHLLETKLEEDLPPGWLAEYEFVCKIAGALPERTNLRRTLLSMLSEQIAGLYDDNSKQLFVLSDFDLSRPLAKIILAHEICHAIQDQHYPLRNLPLRNFEDNDAATAALAVVEGDATLLMQDYAGESMTGSDVLKLVDIFKVDQSALNSAPYFLRQQLIFPYMSGADFLTRIMYQDAGLRELVFVRPPASTEQIMHPDKYSSGDADAPTTVTIPNLLPVLGKDWKRTIRSNWGEFYLKTLFEVWREWGSAAQNTEGWDGDQYVLYRNADKYAYFFKSIWDTEKDAQEFFNGYSELLRTKRYKEQFANDGFGGNFEEVRTLTHNASAETTASGELHLRFRRQGTTVLVQMTNTAAVADRFSELESPLLSRDPTPAND